MQIVKIKFVPSVPPVEFEVEAESLKSPQAEVERQPTIGARPIFEEIRDALRQATPTVERRALKKLTVAFLPKPL